MIIARREWDFVKLDPDRSRMTFVLRQDQQALDQRDSYAVITMSKSPSIELGGIAGDAGAILEVFLVMSIIYAFKST